MRHGRKPRAFRRHDAGCARYRALARDRKHLAEAQGTALAIQWGGPIGTSAMPHKRNPVACAHALAAATRMPGLLPLHAGSLVEHERALGGWQAELAIVPEIASALGSSLDFLETIAASRVVHAARMKSNLDAHGAPGTTTPGDEGAMEELLAELAPFLT